MTDFRFLAENIVSGLVKTQDLALDEWSYDETLNRPGALQAKIPLTALDCTEEILDPWRTAIYAERDGRVEFGGILTPPTLDTGGTALSLSCFGWPGYWDHRFIRTSYTPQGVDQFTIFKHLIDDAQDDGAFGAGTDLGIDVVWDSLSGVLRDRLTDYTADKAKNLGEALRQLAAVEDGFDFAMLCALDVDANRITKQIKLYYPRRGRDTGYVFEYERDHATNVLARGFADPVEFAWAGDGWGSGNDETRLVSPYVDTGLLGIYPRYDAAPSWSSVSVQATLDEHADAWFARRNRPKRIPTLQVDPDLFPRWGDWETGDIVTAKITDGYGSTTPVVGDRFRITGTKVTHDGSHFVVLGDPLADEEES